MAGAVPKGGLPGIHMPHLQYPVPAPVPHNIYTQQNLYNTPQQQQQQQHQQQQQQQQQQQGVVINGLPPSLKNPSLGEKL